MLLINFRKSKFKNTLEQNVFLVRKTLGDEMVLLPIFILFYLFIKIVEPFWRCGICDETNFVPKKQILSPKIIGDEI